MPRVIFKCPYIKGGSQYAAAHLSNYVRYMAIREGAQRVTPDSAQLPATAKQRSMVEQLLRDFPLSRGLFEYEDYLEAPTRGNASEFITRALEDNYDAFAKKENYVSYIAGRPRAQRTGAHALFSASDELLPLSRIADEAAQHPGNVWLPILSLRREDAARLGYDNVENWKQLITGYAMEMAQAMKIPWEQFRWYAAFHDEAHHPHLHMVCYSADGRSGFLTRDGIAQIKSGLAKEIFRQELHELYERQTQRRDALTQEAGAVMAELIRQMRDGALENPRMEQLMEQVKNVVGFMPDGYALVNLSAFVEAVDLLGGLDFDVPMDMDYDDPDQNLFIHLKAGEQHLTGEQLMWVVRFRSGYANADIGRTEVQRAVMKTAMKQWLRPKTLAALPGLWRIYQENLTTDLSVRNIVWMARVLLKGMSGDIEANVLPGYATMAGDASVYMIDTYAASAILPDYSPYK